MAWHGMAWRERLDGWQLASSPILASGRIFITGDEGETFVLATGGKLEVLARNPLGEKVQASPAV